MMNSILNRLKRKADRPKGKGKKDGEICPQCKGSGRVIVSCEVTTYISAYVPENNQK